MHPINSNFFGDQGITITYSTSQFIANVTTSQVGAVTGNTSITVASSVGITNAMTVIDTTNPGAIPAGTTVTITGNVVTTSATVTSQSGDTLLFSTSNNALTGSVHSQINQNTYIVYPTGQASNASAQATISLITSVSQIAPIPPGTGYFTVKPVIGGTEHASNLQGKNVRTVEGNLYGWRKVSATSNPRHANITGNWNLGPDAAGFYLKINI